MVPPNSLKDSLVNGDKAAYTLLFRENYKKLCAYSFKFTRNLSIAEEIVQEVFFRLWEKRSSLNFNDNIESYLYRAVHNESINVYRKTTFENSVKNQLIQSFNSDNTEFHDDLCTEELTKKLKEAIDKLPEKSKEVFNLSRYHSLSYKEIAVKLGITVKGVEFHIIKSLKILRLELKDYLVIIFFIIIN